MNQKTQNLKQLELVYQAVAKMHFQELQVIWIIYRINGEKFNLKLVTQTTLKISGSVFWKMEECFKIQSSAVLN